MRDRRASQNDDERARNAAQNAAHMRDMRATQNEDDDVRARKAAQNAARIKNRSSSPST